MFQSNRLLWWSLLCLTPVFAHAEWREDSQKKVDEALAGLQTTGSLLAQQTNNRVPRSEVEYTKLEETILARDYSKDKIEDLEKYLRLYESLGDEGAAQAKVIRGQLQKHQAIVKDLDKSIKRQEKEIAKYNKTAPVKEIDPHPELLGRVNNWRNEIVRDSLHKIGSLTNQMTTEETIAFLEGICTNWEPNNVVNGHLDKKLAFGPGYGGSDFAAHLRARVIDTLANWGTKEAWAAIGRIADTGGYASTRMVAAQYLLRELTSAKALGLKSIEKPGPNLQLLMKMLADAPHKFNTDTMYYDLETGAVVKFDPANKDFKKANAKERFIPHDMPVSDRKTFTAALENRTPDNRWAQLPGKLKRASLPPKPEEKPTQVVTAPDTAPPPGVGVATPPTQTESVPPVVVDTHTGEPPVAVKVEEKVEPPKPQKPQEAVLVNPITDFPPSELRPVGEQPPPEPPKPQPKPRGVERLMGLSPALDTILAPFLWLQNRMDRSRDRNVASVPPLGGNHREAGVQGDNCGFGHLGRYHHRGNR